MDPAPPPPQNSADLPALIASVDRLVRTMSINQAPALWDVEDIALWMGMSSRTVMARVVTRVGFPEPFVPTGSTEGTNTQKRWFSDEVIEWARRHRAGPRTHRPRR